MARLDTIRALEKRGLSTKLAEKTVELGYQLGTLKKCTLKELEKDFYYKEILQLIDVAKIRSIDRDDIVEKALKEGDNFRRPYLCRSSSQKSRKEIRCYLVIA